MFLHVFAYYCMVSHGFAHFCMSLHVLVCLCTYLHVFACVRMSASRCCTCSILLNVFACNCLVSFLRIFIEFLYVLILSFPRKSVRKWARDKVFSKVQGVTCGRTCVRRNTDNQSSMTREVYVVRLFDGDRAFPLSFDA